MTLPPPTSWHGSCTLLFLGLLSAVLPDLGFISVGVPGTSSGYDASLKHLLTLKVGDRELSLDFGTQTLEEKITHTYLCFKFSPIDQNVLNVFKKRESKSI